MKYLTLAAAAFVLAACRGAESTVAPPDEPLVGAEELQLMVLDELEELIGERFVYPDYGGVDWESESALTRHQIEAGLDEDQFGLAISELVGKLPEGSADYVTRGERIAAEFEASNLYEGIGAFVAFREQPEPRIVLLSVIDGSPAAQAGLRSHDAIFAVDGVPVTSEEGLDVIERVRGPAGSMVTLEVASPSEARREVAVRRGQVAASDMLRGGYLETGMLYLLVPVTGDASLVETMAGLLQAAVQDEREVPGIVLDLRIASSSADWPLAEMLTLLGSGNMGSYFSREGQQPVDIEGFDVGNSQSMPLAILVGPDTTGAPEVLAAALQSSGRAHLVGQPSAGNVLVFERQNLADGSQLTFAESSFVTPDGKDLSLGGVIPDLLVEADWDQVRPGDDQVLFQAIDLLLRSG